MVMKAAASPLVNHLEDSMAVETVRVLQGCVVSRKPRKPGDLVPDVDRMDALHLVSTGLAEMATVKIVETSEEAEELHLPDPQEVRNERQNARSKKRSSSRS